MLPATTEQRRNQRHRTLKAGTISFHHQWASIDCVVRDWSETGAVLTIANQTGIPETFDLMIPKDAVKRPCRVVWRSVNRIGVSFL